MPTSKGSRWNNTDASMLQGLELEHFTVEPPDGAVPTWSHAEEKLLWRLPEWPQIVEKPLDLALPAGTYDALVATGNVAVESISLYVSVPGADFTSVSLHTNQANQTVVLTQAEGVRANIVAQKNLAFAFVRFPFQLRSGQKLRYTLDGTGTGGEIILVATYRPTVAGASATLS